MKTESQRIAWIDNAKFVAIFCVVLGHSFSLIKGNFRGYDNINLLIVAFNMPLFALLSGFTSFKSLTRIHTVTDLVAYLNKITWHIGVPTVVYTLIAMSIGYALQLRWVRCLLSVILLILVCLLVYLLVFSKFTLKFDKIKPIFPYLILPICLVNQSVWYFVYVLFSLFSAALSSYISNRSGNYKRLRFICVFALCSLICARFSPFYSTVELFLPFTVGYLYSSYRGVTPFVNNRLKLCVFAILIGVIGIWAFINYYSIENQFYLLNLLRAIETGQTSIFLIRQISAIFLSVAIVSLIQALSMFYNFISSIGAMTFGIYPIHSQIIGVIKYCIGKITMYNTFLDIAFVVFSTGFLMCVSVLLIIYIRKSQYCKLLLLGEKYACQ